MRRKASGQALVEMAIAIGISGLFVVALSGILSQTLALSAVSQNELIAIHTADELLENARVMNYDYITSNVPLGQTINFLINADGTASQTQLRPTTYPVQLDLTNTSTVYGEVDPATGLLNPANKWSPGFGNYFRGTATETVIQGNGGGISWYQITVDVSYNSNFGTSSPNASLKHVTRNAFVYEYGLNFQPG